MELNSLSRRATFQSLDMVFMLNSRTHRDADGVGWGCVLLTTHGCSLGNLFSRGERVEIEGVEDDLLSDISYNLNDLKSVRLPENTPSGIRFDILKQSGDKPKGLLLLL